MRSYRRLFIGVAPLGLCGLAAALMAPGSAWAHEPDAAARQPMAWIEVRPSPVTAGRNVAIRADCGTGETAASVTSTAFGRVSLHPFAGTLFAEVLVPATTRAGSHSVNLACSNGARAETTLRVSSSGAPTGEPSFGPHTGGGFLARADRPEPVETADPMPWRIGGLAALAAALALAAVWLRRGTVRPSRKPGHPPAGPSSRPDRGAGAP
jgi:hypothetical protein